MKFSSKICLFLMLAMMSFTLCSCGKASSPEVFKDSGYPHSYPRKI